MEDLVNGHRRAHGHHGGHRRRGFREELARVLNSYRFHIAILVLVGFDCLLVFGALIIDLRLFTTHPHCNVSDPANHKQLTEEHHTLETIEKILHFTSIGLLGLFVVEVILKLIAFGVHFFYKFEELIDAIIIIISFVLDIVFINNEFLKFMGVLIFLRLWRIVRIVHAIITAVMTPMEHKIEIEEKRREIAEHKLRVALHEMELLKSKLQAYEQQEKVELEEADENQSPNDSVRSAD
ncbi:Voltage-gated hydrogen channel 1 [Tyrophagus putrescentiae]|nr:Voltage-gated hydrogen channel 1 [Tyrophagus putrescentiae]